jgi:hypothetical protein
MSIQIGRLILEPGENVTAAGSRVSELPTVYDLNDTRDF